MAGLYYGFEKGSSKIRAKYNNFFIYMPCGFLEYNQIHRIGDTPLSEKMKAFIRPNGHWTGDVLFYVFISMGFISLLFPSPDQAPKVWFLAIMAFAEELIFRAVIQESLNRLFRRGPGLFSVSLGNVLASMLFALVHLFTRPPFWAAAAFFPSLVFGIVWDRHKRLEACVFLHFFYNLLYFYL